MRHKPICTDTVLASSSVGVKINDTQVEAARKWYDMLRAGELVDERNNYANFKKIIMIRLLGYSKKVTITGNRGGGYPDIVFNDGDNHDTILSVDGGALCPKRVV